MNLSKLEKWALRQALGSKKGPLVIELLEGPVGAFINDVIQGRAVAALAKLDEAIEHLRGLGE